MKLEAVSFAYGDKTVFWNFSLELPDDGITAISGASGCGKTTLLRLIAGLEMPQSGTISVPSRCAFLFQENRLLPRRTAAEQVRLVLPRGEDPLPWLKAVGLEAEANTTVEELSGGMQRRTALARCLAYARTQELLLLDEPFAGVDPARASGIAAFLRTLRLPVVYTAHNRDILTLADRIISL